MTGEIDYYDGHASGHDQRNKCNGLEGAFKKRCLKRMTGEIEYYDGNMFYDGNGCMSGELAAGQHTTKEACEGHGNTWTDYYDGNYC